MLAEIEFLGGAGSVTGSPSRTFIVHGEPLASNTLQQNLLSKLHVKAHIPQEK